MSLYPGDSAYCSRVRTFPHAGTRIRTEGARKGSLRSREPPYLTWQSRRTEREGFEPRCRVTIEGTLRVTPIPVKIHGGTTVPGVLPSYTTAPRGRRRSRTSDNPVPNGESWTTRSLARAPDRTRTCNQFLRRELPFQFGYRGTHKRAIRSTTSAQANGSC